MRKFTMLITAFCVLFFIKLSLRSSFNFIHKIINKNCKIALARKIVKSGHAQLHNHKQIPQLAAELPKSLILDFDITETAENRLWNSMHLGFKPFFRRT